MAELKRALSLWQVTLMGVGCIVGAGVYIIIGEASGLSGNGLWISFIIAAIASVFTGLSYAELSYRFPHAGAEYVYVEESFGKTSAWLVGWLIIVGSIIGATTVSIGFSHYFSAIFGSPIILTALITLVIMGVILIIGVQETALITIIFTLIEVGGLIAIIVFGIPYLGSVNYFEMVKGWGGIIDASILIFFAYQGFESISRLAEETENPKKNIPRAIIYSIVIVTIIYALVGIAAVSVVGWEELSEAKAPLALIAEKVFGRESFFVLSVIALFATFNTALFILLSGSRIVYGMAEEKALPRKFLLVSKKLRTPWFAIIGIVAASMVFLYIGDLATVANLTNFTVIAAFIVVNASVIYFRYKKPIKDGFKVPISIGKFPVLPFMGVVISFFMLTRLEIIVLLLGIFLIGLGIVINFVWKVKTQ